MSEPYVVSVRKPFQCAVDAETGDILIESADPDLPTVVIEIADLACFDEFLHNALDALRCFTDRLQRLS